MGDNRKSREASFLKNLFIFNWRRSLYNIVINIVTFLVSAIHKHKSAIAIHMSPPSGTTLEAALWALALCMGAAQPSWEKMMVYKVWPGSLLTAAKASTCLHFQGETLLYVVLSLSETVFLISNVFQGMIYLFWDYSLFSAVKYMHVHVYIYTYTHI